MDKGRSQQKSIVRAPARVIASLRLHGSPRGIQRLVDRASAKLFSPLMHANTVPRLSLLAGMAEGVHSSADELVAALFPSEEHRIDELVVRYREIEQDLQQQVSDQDFPFPHRISIERETSMFVYLFVRLAQPRSVLETGVANGRSTALILNALEENESGRLTSIDVSSQVGRLVSDRHKDRWELRVLPLHNLARRFDEAISDLAGIDLFMHDSDHNYRWMKHEFESVSPRLAPDSWIIADDVDQNRAFAELCEDHSQRPRLLFDNRKMVGILHRTS